MKTHILNSEKDLQKFKAKDGYHFKGNVEFNLDSYECLENLTTRIKGTFLFRNGVLRIGGSTGIKLIMGSSFTIGENATLIMDGYPPKFKLEIERSSIDWKKNNELMIIDEQ